MDDDSRSEDIEGAPGEPRGDEQLADSGSAEGVSAEEPEPEAEALETPAEVQAAEPQDTGAGHPGPRPDDLWADDLLDEPEDEGSAGAARELLGLLGGHLARHDKAAFVRTAVESVTTDSLTIPELYRDVLTPLLVDTGAAWQRGQVAVWEEHLASAAVRTVVEILYPGVLKAKLAVPAAGRSVLLAAPPEEHHDLGLRMIADRFDMAGWTTYFLGADTPVEEMIDAARKLGVDAVVLTSATHFHRLALRHFVDQLQRELAHVHIWVGGSAFRADDEGWASFEVRDIETILAEFTPAPPAADAPEASEGE